VDFAFGDCDAMEDADSVLFHKGRQLAGFDELADILKSVAVIVVMIAALVIMVVVTVSVGVFGMRIVVFFISVIMAAAVVVFVLMLMGVGLFGVAVFVGMGLSVIVIAALVLLLSFVGMSVGVFMLMVVLAVVCVGEAVVDIEFHAFDLLPLCALVVHVKLAELQLVEFPFECAGFDAEIDECADSHVAADA